MPTDEKRREKGKAEFMKVGVTLLINLRGHIWCT
jgi:hypothetical protein